MYKLFLLLPALFFTLNSLAQEVRIVDNKGTIQKIRNNNVYTSSTDPRLSSNDIVENDIWLDTSTTPSTTNVFDDNNQWVTLATGSSTYTGFFIIDGNTSQTISGIPFQPSQITFVGHANIEDLATVTDNDVGNNTRGINKFIWNKQWICQR